MRKVDTSPRRKDAILRRLKRNLGMTPEVRARVAKLNAEKTDWFGTCRWCGIVRSGTLAEITKDCGCEKSKPDTGTTAT